MEVCFTVLVLLQLKLQNGPQALALNTWFGYTRKPDGEGDSISSSSPFPLPWLVHALEEATCSLQRAVTVSSYQASLLTF